MDTSTAERRVAPSAYTWPIIASLTVFAIWMTGTWLLEGRVHTFLRPDAAAARLTYALIANILLGIGVSAVVLERFLRADLLDRGRSGVVLRARTAVAIIAGLALGAVAYGLQGGPSWDPVVLTNAFAQALVVSSAEVLVCWVVVGNTVREALRDRSPVLATIVAAVAASALFGLYHFAHSPPFNTWEMVGLLSVVGLFTSAFYFVSRDVWGTILFHNWLALIGIVGALVENEALEPFQTLIPPLFITATLAATALVAAQYWLARKGS